MSTLVLLLSARKGLILAAKFMVVVSACGKRAYLCKRGKQARRAAVTRLARQPSRKHTWRVNNCLQRVKRRRWVLWFGLALVLIDATGSRCAVKIFTNFGLSLQVIGGTVCRPEGCYKRFNRAC